jgi:DnaK suppressor protein
MSTKTAAHAAELTADRATEVERIAGLRREFADVVAASEANIADDEHDPEGSTIAFERSQVGTLVDQARHQLEEIDAALDRLAAGEYGVCERCRQEIPPARLEARPVARLCVSCASR